MNKTSPEVPEGLVLGTIFPEAQGVNYGRGFGPGNATGVVAEMERWFRSDSSAVPGSILTITHADTDGKRVANVIRK